MESIPLICIGECDHLERPPCKHQVFIDEIPHTMYNFEIYELLTKYKLYCDPHFEPKEIMNLGGCEYQQMNQKSDEPIFCPDANIEIPEAAYLF